MPRMTLLTWNVHGFADAQGRPRMDDVVGLLARCDPDVIALQEAPRAQAHDLARRLGRHAVYAPAAWMGCVLLARAPWRSPETLTLHAPGGEARSAAWGVIDVAGAALGVAVTHLDHRSEAVRVAEVDQLLAALPPAVDVVVGDLNAVHLDELDSERRAALDRERAFRRWEPLAGDVLERLRRAGFEDVVGPRLEGRATVSTSRAGIRIDHVLARGDRCRATAAAVLDTDASDHRAVHVTLEVDAAARPTAPTARGR